MFVRGRWFSPAPRTTRLGLRAMTRLFYTTRFLGPCVQYVSPHRLFMIEQEIIDLVVAAIPDAQVQAHMEGSHAHITVTSTAFTGLSPVKKQQLVYAALGEAIASGAIHAVHIKTIAPSA